MGKKSIYVAYFLWLIGGVFGLHLLYLGRDRQTFLYWTTFGGYFGLALFRDFICIPHYVRDANNDPSIMAKLSLLMHKHKKPPFSVGRLIGELVIGNSWCYLFVAALPESDEHYGHYFQHLKYLGPIASALGTWTVGNIGRTEGSFKWCLIGAFMAVPMSLVDPTALSLSALTSAIFLEWKGKTWRRRQYNPRSFCRRFTTLSTAWLLFCSLWAMYIYFNAEVTLKTGEKVKFKTVMGHFFRSPMYTEFKDNLRKLYDDVKAQGLRIAWHNLMELLDPYGENHALKIMSLQRGVSQADLKAKYRELTKEWHPDRHKDAKMKQIAQKKFIEIANAYEVLSTMKKKRKRKSEQSTTMERNDDYDEFDEFEEDLRYDL